MNNILSTLDDEVHHFSMWDDLQTQIEFRFHLNSYSYLRSRIVFLSVQKYISFPVSVSLSDNNSVSDENNSIIFSSLLLWWLFLMFFLLLLCFLWKFSTGLDLFFLFLWRYFNYYFAIFFAIKHLHIIYYLLWKFGFFKFNFQNFGAKQ